VSRLGLDSLLTEEDDEDSDGDGDDGGDDDEDFVELIPVGKGGATTYRTTALARTTLYRLKSHVFTVLPVDKNTLFPREWGLFSFPGSEMTFIIMG
jgi:hypothetical protein